eukprot:766293-Hanusia_phi.AAC.4
MASFDLDGTQQSPAYAPPPPPPRDFRKPRPPLCRFSFLIIEHEYECGLRQLYIPRESRSSPCV